MQEDSNTRGEEQITWIGKDRASFGERLNERLNRRPRQEQDYR